jgi:hypothetical protein
LLSVMRIENKNVTNIVLFSCLDLLYHCYKKFVSICSFEASSLV